LADLDARSAKATLLVMQDRALPPPPQLVGLFRYFLFLSQQSDCSLIGVEQLHFLPSAIELFSLLDAQRLMRLQRPEITE
jgi:hypothetical protein